MNEVMLDIETFSTRNNAAIAVISAIKFKRNEKNDYENDYENDYKNDYEKDEKIFYELIDEKSCQEIGMDFDEKTIKWWKTQPEKIQKEVFSGERKKLKEVLLDFKKWYGNSSCIWSQGANFDIPILEEAYRKLNIEPPWKFWQARDTRTIYDLANIKSFDLPQNNLHNALEDCKRQIYGVQKSYEILKKI